MPFGAAALGLLIGVVIGGLGGGGGVLTVPALVYLLGQDPQHATTGSVLIVGTAAAVGVLSRLRSGAIDWRTGIAFGVVGLPSTYLGTVLNRTVAEAVLLSSFAGLTVLAAIAMLLDSRGTTSDPATPSPPATEAGRWVDTRAATARRQMVAAAKIGGGGAAVGLLTGFLGVGGGFLVVPVLVIALRQPMSRAIGTSLLVILLNSVSAMTARLPGLQLDWTVVAPFGLAAVAGTLIGRLGAKRLTSHTLSRAFAVLLLCVGAAVGVESVLAH
jgi:uncharacterized protein